VDATALATPVAVVGAAMTCLWIQTVVSQQLYIILGCLIQALFVVPFLLLVYGLTCDGGSSATSRALQLPPARWLGQISYSLYLSHNMIRQYVDAVRHSTGNPSQYPPQESYSHPYSGAWVGQRSRVTVICLVRIGPTGFATPAQSLFCVTRLYT
jgi:hypothetical protein